MSKLPSERIKDINDKEIPFAIRDSNIGLVHAIIQYLDEQYEQQKPLECEHNGMSRLNDGRKFCQDCMKIL